MQVMYILFAKNDLGCLGCFFFFMFLFFQVYLTKLFLSETLSCYSENHSFFQTNKHSDSHIYLDRLSSFGKIDAKGWRIRKKNILQEEE